MELIKEIPKNRNKSIWNNKQFLSLWLGTSISNLTFHILILSIPLIIYDLTKSTFFMSTMRVVEIVPNIVLGIFIGVLVDRLDRKRFMVASIIIQLISILIIIYLLIIDQLYLWHLYVLGFFIYTCAFSFGNIYHTILPLIVNRKELTTANSAIQFMTTFINIIGPAFAGFLLLYISYSFGLSVTILGLLLLVFIVKRINIPKSNIKKQNIKKDIKEGWYHLTETKDLWYATLMVVAFNLASTLNGAVLIFYAIDYLETSEKELGLVLSSAAIGGFIGSWLAKKSRGYFSRGNMFIGAYFIVCISQFICGFSNEWISLSIGMMVMGLGVTIFNIHYLTLRQEKTPNNLLGRVTGTSSMLMKTTMPVGYLIAGILGEYITINYIFFGSGLLLLIIVLCALFSPVKSIT